MNVPATPMDELLPSEQPAVVVDAPTYYCGGCDPNCFGAGGCDCAGCSAPDGCFDAIVNLFAAWYGSWEFII